MNEQLFLKTNAQVDTREQKRLRMLSDITSKDYDVTLKRNAKDRYSRPKSLSCIRHRLWQKTKNRVLQTKCSIIAGLAFRTYI